MTPLQVNGRAHRVAATLGADGEGSTAGVEALIVENLTNVRWLTGFTGSNGLVVLGADEQLTLITDGRYGDQARAEAQAYGLDLEVLVGATGTTMLQHLATAVGERSTIGFEPGTVSVARHAQLVAALGAERLRSCSGVVEAHRRLKEPGELERMEQASIVASEALADVGFMLYQGVTERDFQLMLDRRMEDLGAQGPSYDTIVASGPTNSAMPHHRHSDRRIVKGDVVVIDVGALVDGYHSDMTRTYFIGDPDPWLRDAYALLADVQSNALNATKPGRSGQDTDLLTRQPLAEAGYGEYYIHGSGHGVGLLIHETPFATKSSSDDIREGDVVTIEPGLYRMGVGGLRIEDMVVVTATGCRSMTHTPKDPSCPPLAPTI